MTALLTIARREVVDATRDGRIRAAMVAVLLLVLGALVAGGVEWHRQARDQRAATELTRMQWDGLGAMNPHSAVHYGMHAFKPKLPLALLEPGVDPWMGSYTLLEGHRWNEFQARPAQDATELRRFPPLSAATVLYTFLPLLVVFLTFGAVAREREDGTLRHLLTTGVSPATVVLGKVLGSVMLVGLLLLPILLLGLVAVVLADGSLTGGTWQRVAAFAGVQAMHLLVWVLVAVGLSAVVRTPRTALLILLAGWGGATFLIPRLAAAWAARTVPIPTYAEFTAAISADKAQGLDGHSPRAARNQAFQDRVLAQYGVATVAELPVSFEGLSLQASEVQGDSVNDRHYKPLWGLYQAQDSIQARAARWSPPLAARLLSTAVAGTDLAEHLRFQRAAESYRRYFVEMMNHDMTVHGVGKGYNYLADSSLWLAVRPFETVPVSVAQALAPHRIASQALGAWVLLGGLLVGWGTIRVGRAA